MNELEDFAQIFDDISPFRGLVPAGYVVDFLGTITNTKFLVNGRVFVSVGLLEGPNDKHVFTAAGQEMVLGGFEICLLRKQPSPLDIRQVTDISELPLLPDHASGLASWDFIEGLRAEVV